MFRRRNELILAAAIIGRSKAGWPKSSGRWAAHAMNEASRYAHSGPAIGAVRDAPAFPSASPMRIRAISGKC